MERRVLPPPDFGKPLGAAYCHGFEVQTGRLVFVAAQLAIETPGRVAGDGSVEARTRAVLENIRKVPAEAEEEL